MIRRIRPEDYEEVHDLVIRSFDRFVAGYFSEVGNQSFYSYADIDSFNARLRMNYEAFVLDNDGVIAGMVEIKSRSHISMLFVDPDCTLSGFGRMLMEFTLDYCRSTKPFLRSVTVNASPYAINFYKKLGFQRNGDPITNVELTSYPMVKYLDAGSEKKLRFSLFRKKYGM